MARDRILILGGSLKPDRRLLGGKVLGLLSTLEAGFDTPEGLVVTSEVFLSLFVESYQRSWSELTLDWLESQGLESIQQRIRTFTLPPSLMAWLDHQLSGMDSPHGFAVRSSAALEDGTQQTFAGVFETRLGTQNLNDVCVAIREVWASSFREVAFHCFRRMGLTRPPEIAVLVQQLIRPDVSGVAFTANPDTGNFSEMLVLAARGMGGGVVSGTADTDSYCLEKTPLGVQAGRREIPRKKVYQEVDGTLCQYADDDPAMTAPLLTDGQLAELGSVFQQLELHQKMPLDIEWALWQNKIIILQARPIITRFHHYSADLESWREPRLLVRSVFAVQEAPATPLLSDLVERGLGRFLLHRLQQGSEGIRLASVSGYLYLSLPFGEDEDGRKDPQAEKLARRVEGGLALRRLPAWRQTWRRLVDRCRSFFTIPQADPGNEPPTTLSLALIEYERVFAAIEPDLFAMRQHILYLLELLQRLEEKGTLPAEDEYPGAWPLSAINLVFRDVLTEIVQAAVRIGISAQDVAFFSISEILDEQRDQKLKIRRGSVCHVERDYHAGFRPPPPVIHNRERLILTLRDHPTIIRGIPVAGGCVQGPAILWKENIRPNDLGKHTILVCNTAVLACAELFHRIQGLVVEDSRTLTHALILSRELGIPTVAGVRGITSLITDGTILQINGDAGIVEL